MGDAPTVSIITIFYNAESLLEKTMRSVLEQTYPHIEYVLVNNNSTDDSQQVAQRIAADYPRRRVVFTTETVQGIAAANNRGALTATGEVLNHLHAGDGFLGNDVIANVMATRAQNPWRWAIAGSVVVDGMGLQKHIYRPAADYRVLKKKNMVPHQSTFLVKDIFEQHGLFRPDLKQGMDYEFWLRIAFLGGERYTVLPFETTTYLEGGRSSRVRELLPYLLRIRREFRGKNVGMSEASNLMFVSRVAAFWLYSELKTKLRQVAH